MKSLKNADMFRTKQFTTQNALLKLIFESAPTKTQVIRQGPSPYKCREYTQTDSNGVTKPLVTVLVVVISLVECS